MNNLVPKVWENMQTEEKISLNEEHATHHTMAFVRMNPPHAGHGELVDKVLELQNKHGGTHGIVLSKTHDSKKNPLSPEQKLKHVQNAFPHANIETDDHFLKHLSKLHKKGVTHLHWVSGSDRLDRFKEYVNQYNGVKSNHGYYKFKHIDFHSSGERDPDAEGVEGYSASKMREHAHNNDYKSFAAAAPKTMKPEHVKSMFNDVKKGMEAPKKKLKEEACAQHFKALFLVGGPGSGKDFLIHSTLNELNLKEVSMERIFNAIVKETNIEELENFPSVIVNGNADNMDKIVVTKAIMETMGYDTAMIYVYTSDETSKNRNDFRLAQGAKTFNEEVRQKKYNKSVENLKEYMNMFETFVIYDNSSNFITTDETKKTEIVGWLSELTEKVVNFVFKDPSNEATYDWIVERVLEVGTYETNRFSTIITPGQVSNKAYTYSEADKIVPSPKFKEDPKLGDKYKGGVAYASKNSTERLIPEAKVTKVVHKKVKEVHEPRPPTNYATLGTGSTYQNTGGGAQIGPNSEDVLIRKDVKKTIKNKVKPAIPPSALLKFNAAGGGGDYVPSVGSVRESKKQKKHTTLKYTAPDTPVTAYGNVQNLGTGSAVGGFPSLRETKKKKFKPLPGPRVSSGLSAQDQGSAENLTTSLESTDFETLKNKMLSTAYNFDQELEK